MGLTLRTAVQKADLGMLDLALQKEEFGKYLDLRTLEMWLSGSSTILQAAERTKLLLVACKFLIPSPPSFFGAQISFQALRHKDLELESFLTPVHQKFLITAVSLAKNFLGKRMFVM